MVVFCFTVPLGSVLELPAHSCKEIRASEGEGSISSNYWLDVTQSGMAVLAYCDMKNMTMKSESVIIDHYQVLRSAHTRAGGVV